MVKTEEKTELSAVSLCETSLSYTKYVQYIKNRLINFRDEVHTL